MAATLRPPRIGQPLPRVYITMECKLRDFLADQQRIATLKCDWLYKLCSPDGRAKMLREAGFAPVRPEPALVPAATASRSRARESLRAPQPAAGP